MSTILLAIDETHLANRLMSTFKDAGLAVICVGNGLEAYRTARSVQPDLIVADYRLAQLGGPELITKLRNDGATRDIPVVLLTARGFGTPASGLPANVKRVITKPVSPFTMLTTVRLVLRRFAVAAGVA